MNLGNETFEQIRERREAVKERYGSLFDKVSEILFRNDPIKINFEVNTDEYEPEVGTILPRLEGCTSHDEVLTIVHEEFQKWFNIEAGSKQRYTQISKEIWDVWASSEQGSK